MKPIEKKIKPWQKLPYWLVAVVLLGVASAVGTFLHEDYTTIFLAVWSGLWITLYVTVIAFTFSLILGLLVGLARVSKKRKISEVATFYIEVVRGIPMLVILYYIAFVGAPSLIGFLNWVFSPLIEMGGMDAFRVRDLDFTWRAILALTIGYSAFLAEIFRAGIESIEEGQIEAARALGLTPWQSMRLVILPQAIRVVLPPLGNDFISMIKDSSLVSALGVPELTQLGKVYSASSFLFFETYNMVALLYLAMTITLARFVHGLEKRMRYK